MTDTSATSTTQTGTQSTDSQGSATQSTATQSGSSSGTAPFYSSFKDADLRGYIENKGFKETEVLANSYRNLEKLTGVPAEQLVRLPKDDDKESWGKVYDRLGRPAKPEDYELSVPEGGDAEYAKYISTTMHELGITKKQAQALAAKQNEYVTQQKSKQAENYTNTIKAQDDALRSKWGQAYDKNIQVARGSFAQLGIDTKTVDALEKSIGFTGVMEFFHNIGSKIGEDKFVSGSGMDGFSGVMSPDAARARIEEIKRDPVLSNKYIKGDAAVRREMTALHKMLAG